MNVLLLEDILVAYLSRQFDKDEHREMVEKLIWNTGSRLLHSKKFIDRIKDKLPEDAYHSFTSLVTRMSDSGGNVVSGDGSLELVDELKNIVGSVNNAPVLSFSLNKVSEEVAAFIPNVAVVSECSKPNYNWLATQLAISHPNVVDVHVFDFTTDKDVKIFFRDLFALSPNLSKAIIFDRETVAFGHGKLDRLKQGVSVTYCTLRHANYLSDENNIVSYFNKLRIFTTTNKLLCHSRKIIFDNIIFDSNNALNNLAVGGDWTITVKYCDKEAKNWINNLRYYVLTYPKP